MEEMNKNTEIKKEEKGATSIEYALIAGLVGIVIIGGAGTLGTNINNKLNTIAANVANAGN
jgi:pilus assembly protein Flp/PilA